MIVPDLDDYYSLTEYVSRFSSKAEVNIALWLSQISTLSIIELWETSNGNSEFRKENVPFFLDKIENDELLDIDQVISALNITGIVRDGIQILASQSLYYDFVSYLTQKRINCR
ncbi:MAG: hypothetical protein J6R23_06295 [Spirochaetales bacterium]|nr:hypothetical protein [Spirochaetales bacterium]